MKKLGISDVAEIAVKVMMSVALKGPNSAREIESLWTFPDDLLAEAAQHRRAGRHDSAARSEKFAEHIRPVVGRYRAAWQQRAGATLH
jgi:hypothetical protein